jgi:pyruvate/2-oxoglutarate dehydrogenase complex dihydrolipoamide dehydrogenase (E3) component
MAFDYDLVIIGGGSGGLVVASIAAQLKAKVALVEKARLGGDCLWYGCVPSKSFIHAGRAAYQVKTSDRFGVYTQPPTIKFKEAMGHVNQVIKTIEPHDSPERFRGLGVEVIFGAGAFKNKKTFMVNGQELKARNYVLSTGSRPAVPPIPGLAEAGYLTNEQVFSLQEQPKSLIVIGAGPIGCELGQAFHRLGTQVTILASRDQLLPKEEPAAAAIIQQQFRDEGIEVMVNARATKVEVRDGLKRVHVGDRVIEAEEILISTGRAPNVEGLNLTGAAVEFGVQGVKVNSKLQTTNPKIYACGDIIGGYQFTHVAGYEAYYVTINALNPLGFLRKSVDYRVIPWATFTDPELARVGLTEQEARDRYGDDIYILQQPYAGVDRAQAEGETIGFSKIITKGDGTILGAHLVGAIAGELIHEIVLAMRYRLPVSALTGIHIYPTMAELNSKAGLLLTKQKYAEKPWQQSLLTNIFNFRRRIGF